MKLVKALFFSLGIFLSFTVYSKVPKVDVSIFQLKNFNQLSNAYLLMWMGAVVVFFILFSIFHGWMKNRRFKKTQKDYQERKEKTKLRELDISASSLQLIQEMAAQTKKNWEEIVSDNRQFELAVNKLQKKRAQAYLLEQIPSLRNDLEFVFFNVAVPFLTTKMMQIGQKVRAGVTVKGKEHSYIAAVMNISESELWVNPPTVKGKVVDLSQFKKLDISVFRKDDGEFRFSCKVKKQVNTPMHAIITQHTDKITKLQTREYDRYALKFKRKFNFLDGELTGEVKIGTVIDISLGGMKIYLDELPKKAEVGNLLQFSLKEAKIQKKIQAQIVRLGKEDDQLSVHVQFTDLTELSRLHLEKFIASKKPIKLACY